MAESEQRDFRPNKVAEDAVIAFFHSQGRVNVFPVAFENEEQDRRIDFVAERIAYDACHAYGAAIKFPGEKIRRLNFGGRFGLAFGNRLD